MTLPSFKSDNDALKAIMQIMAQRSLSPKDVADAYKLAKNENTNPEQDKSGIITRLLVYLGGLLVFAGLIPFIAVIWDDIDSLPRVILALGSGITAYILGLVFAKDKKMTTAATPAFLVSFFLLPTGMFVLLHEYFGGGDPLLGIMLVFGILAVQLVFTFWNLKRTAILFFAIIYSLCFAGALIEYLEFHRAISSMIIGLTLFLLSVDLHKRKFYSALSPFLFLLAAPAVWSGLYYFIGHTIYDPLNLSLLLVSIGIAVTINSRTLFALTFLGIISYYIGGPGGIWGWRDAHFEITMAVSGVSLVLTGLWLRQVSASREVPIWLFFGSGWCLAGLFALLQGTSVELIYLSLACIGIYAALQLHSRAILVVSAFSLLGYIGYFTAEHFADTLGWPLAVMLMGLTLIGVGIYTVKLGQRINTVRV